MLWLLKKTLTSTGAHVDTFGEYPFKDVLRHFKRHSGLYQAKPPRSEREALHKPNSCIIKGKLFTYAFVPVRKEAEDIRPKRTSQPAQARDALRAFLLQQHKEGCEQRRQQFLSHKA